MKSLEFQYQIIITTVVVVGVLSLPGFVLPEKFADTEFLSGELAEIIEDRYDEELPLKRFAANSLTAFTLLMFGEASPGVVVGANHWLFTDEEFIADLASEATYQTNLSFIQSANETLRSQNIELLIVPVPSKARVYAELTLKQPAGAHRDLYQRITRDLGQRGAHVVDTLPGLMAGKAQREMYLVSDTHWTPEGAANVAGSVRSTLEARSLEGSERWLTQGIAPLQHEGDLLNFVDVSPWFESLTGSAEVIDQFSTENAAAVDLFSMDVSPDVALVGTSYSANPRFHFEGFIKSAVGGDVVNFSEEGKGPFAPMAEFLELVSDQQKHNADQTSFRLVIWEIPERYLIHRDYVVANF